MAYNVNVAQSCPCTENNPDNPLGIYQMIPSSEKNKEFEIGEENKETVRKFFIGNNIKTNDWDEAKQKVIERDHPDLLDVAKGIPLKTKCVPPLFYTKFPKVLSHSEWEQKQRKLDRSRARSRAAIKEERHRIMGNQAERIIFDKLKHYFEGDDVLIVHSHLFLYGSGPAREKDFLVLNLTKGYFMHLEVKLSGKPERFHRAMNQLKDGRFRMQKLIDSIDGISKLWVWIGTALFQYPHSDLQFNCSNCQDFVFFGFDGFDMQLRSIEQKIDNFQQTQQWNHVDHQVEFVEIAKQLLFVAQGNPGAPVTRDKVVEKTITVLDKGSELENIFFWTPQQKSAVESMGQPHMVLFGYYGTGKTLILKKRAWHLLKTLETKKSDIYLYTMRDGNHEFDALIETFKAEFKNNTKVKVRTMSSLIGSIRDNLRDDEVTSRDHVIIDEFTIFDKTLEMTLSDEEQYDNGVDDFITSLTKAKSLVASLWIAVGGLHSKFSVSTVKDKVKEVGFACPDLEYSLRNTNSIVKYSGDEPVNLELGASVFLNVNVKYNQVFEGLPVDEVSTIYGAPMRAFKSAYSKIPANTKAVIFIYLSDMKIPLDLHMLARRSTKKERFFKKITKEYPEDKFVSFHDTDGAKQWFRSDRNKNLDAHLVYITENLDCYPIRGIECDVMIYVYPQQCRNVPCKAKYVIPSAITRCRAQLIVRQYRWEYDNCGQCQSVEDLEEKLKNLTIPDGTVMNEYMNKALQ